MFGTCVLWFGRSTVGRVEATDLKDASSRPADGSVRLRTDVYDALAAERGYKTVESQVGWHGLTRSNWFRIRAGGPPRLDTAMRVAADLGVAVEVIWERQP